MKLIQRLVTYLSLFFVFVSCLWILHINPSLAYTYDSKVGITSKIPLNLSLAYTNDSEEKIISKILPNLMATKTQSNDTAEDIPSNLISEKIPSNPISNTGVQFFNAFAWQTFIALNWPADCNTGEAFPEEQIEIGQKPDAPRVWEFYSYPAQVFLPNGKNPTDQDGKLKYQFSPPQCLPKGNNEQLKYLAKLPNLKLSEGVSKDQSILDPKYPLIDRQGNYIINEKRMNPIEVNEILKNSWYNAENLKKFNSSDNLFKLVCSKKIDGYNSSDYCNDYDNEGAIEIKAAWMVAQDMDEKEREKYYITKRAIDVDTEDGNKVPKIVDVALVGFHILHKTSSSGWVIATFEHIKNAPDNNDIDQQNNTDENYNLYNTNCAGKRCPGNNRVTAQKPYLWGLKETDKSLDNVTNTIYAMTNNKGENEPQIPSQITRENPINMYEEKSNEKLRKLLKSMNAWPQFYQLIGVQWLGSPGSLFTASSDVSQSLNGEQHLANVALEPFDQKFSSCFKCHYGAKLPNSNAPADLSFLIGHAED
ncbi:MAG: hypothetical protein F6K39_06440 [Okeania sp. SIO3B3]|nr:hypothetical protein [Okeania sp. SIO3B3]